ncbi:three-Cys-motif partner protein TcmP [Membranihabitans marinus]|uniref:three-Cys-motif partner protein TcmP n=1 Tax=Membranihabitans marinus TaxID=1227546 RepID=UPI001F44E227|nr:three-Cys-motif partner protein TcmP [Membranihabitans marinus]
MAKKESQNTLLAHSEAKIKLFGQYIQKYLNIIVNDGYTEQIHLYDLFCGPGVYDNNGEGSPIIALRKLKLTYYQFVKDRADGSPKINCNFNDSDPELISRLKENIIEKKLHYNSYGQLNLTSEDYIDIVDRLSVQFKALKKEKAFVFIDPYGYKEVRASHIFDLLNCNKKSEVLLWLPIQFMYRFSENGTPDVLKSFNEQLGIEKENTAIKNVWEYIFELKNGFQTFLGQDYFVDNFTLRKEENTVFCLFFFSSHIRGYEKMLETKWELDTEAGRGWKYNGQIKDLFSGQETNRLEELLLPYLKGEGRTNGMLFEFTLRQGFLPKHLNQILKELQKNEKIELQRKDGSKPRKGAFYINYDAYKSEYDKLSIKLK